MSEAQVDELLVERVQKGDKRAFDLLINKYQHRIISLVGRYVSDPAEAMDVSQEAFIKAYRAIDRFRGDSAFYTWLVPHCHQYRQELAGCPQAQAAVHRYRRSRCGTI